MILNSHDSDSSVAKCHQNVIHERIQDLTKRGGAVCIRV